MYIFRIVTILTVSALKFKVLCSKEARLREGINIAEQAYVLLNHMYDECFRTSLSSRRFLIDDLHNYINTNSKTTVGLAPQFTASRKFFVNMIAHSAFKTMLEEDVTQIQSNMVDKMRFCDVSALNPEILKQMYDREVDQTKL